MRTDIKDFVLCRTAPFYPLHDLTRFADPAENTHFFAGLVLWWVSELNYPCEVAGEHRSWHQVAGDHSCLRQGEGDEVHPVS